MLQFIRTHAQGWIALLIVGIIAIAFTLWGLEGAFSFRNEDVVATIDKKKITTREFDRAYERMARFRRPTSSEEVDQLKRVALDRLINMAVLDETTESMGLMVSEGQVRRTIMSSPDFQVDGEFSQQRYLNAIRGAMLTDQDVHNEIRHMMTVEQLQRGIIDSAFVLDEDIDDLVSYIEQKRKLGYFRIPVSRFEDDVIVQDDSVKEYFESHRSLFTLPEQVKVDYIELSLTPIAASMNLTEDEVREFYLEHSGMFSKDALVRASHILVSMNPNASDTEEEIAKKALDEIYEKLSSGERFEQLAIEYSDDLISAREGGDLDWFGKGQMIESFENAAFKLKVGEISDPVRSDYGYHIIKVTDYKDPELLPFEEAKEEVEAKLRNLRSEEILYDSIESASTLAFEYPNSLEPVADALGLEVETSNFFSREGCKGIFSHPRIVSAAFSPDVYDEHLNSELIQIHPEAYVLLRVKDVQPERLQEYKEVSSEIRAALKAKQARELTKGLADDLKNEIEKGVSPTKLASERNVEWKVIDNLERTDQRVESQFVDLAFAMARPVNNTPVLATKRLASGDYYTLQLFEITNGDVSAIEPDKIEALRKGVENSFGQTDYQLLLANSVKDKRIDINLQ